LEIPKLETYPKGPRNTPKHHPTLVKHKGLDNNTKRV